MRVLVNNWSDEARAASMEVRRSKRQERGRQDMIERKRKEFFAAIGCDAVLGSNLFILVSLFVSGRATQVGGHAWRLVSRDSQ